MNRENQINEMAMLMTEGARPAIEDAEALYNAGYRKIYDDHQRQCTCYALGCQMAEELEKKVAEEIFAEIEGIMAYFPIYGHTNTLIVNENDFAELKKKYTESEEGKWQLF